MKNINFILTLFIMLFLPISVFAANDVGYNLGKYECTSKYQDDNISTYGSANFSHCILYYKENNKCTYEYYSSNKVICLNGNRDPYYQVYKDGCKQTECTKNIKYCSIIINYDCGRRRNGESFYTTTTTTKNTTKRTNIKTTKTTTTTTTTEIVYNTKLKNLSLSNASIIFNPDIYEYSVNLNQEQTSIDVTAVPEDELCNINVENNTNLVDGSVIIVKVTAPNGAESIYKINVNINKALSNNNKLKSLTVDGYSIPFSSNINEYSLLIDEGISELNINYEVDEEHATVLISGNNNLKNGSKIAITVYAEDGTENYYYIDIVKEKSNFLGILFIIVLILAIGAGGYYIYKKLIVNKGGEKYEYE